MRTFEELMKCPIIKKTSISFPESPNEWKPYTNPLREP